MPTVSIAALRIDLVKGAQRYTITYDEQHGPLADSAPMLNLKVEDKLNEFTAGGIELTCNNLDSFWDSRFPSLCPFDRWPDVWQIMIYRGGTQALRWAGCIDYASILFDRKARTCSFKVDGDLTTLEKFSAEVVRKVTLPSCGIWESFDWGYGASLAGSLPNFVVTDMHKSWHPNQFQYHHLIDGNGAPFAIQSNDATHLTLLSLGGFTPNMGTNGAYVIRPFVFRTALAYSVPLSDGQISVSGSTFTDNAASFPPHFSVGLGLFLFDQTGKSWAITDNGATTITFTPGVDGSVPKAGPYSVRSTNYARLLQAPADAVWIIGGIAAQLAGPPPVQGDRLALETYQAGGVFSSPAQDARGAPVSLTSGERPGGPRKDRQRAWVFRKQNVLQQQVDVVANNDGFQPILGAPANMPSHSLWIGEDLQADLAPGDAIYVLTPYFRQETVSALVTQLVAAVGFACYAAPGNDIVVPYADFDQKSVADALAELASISQSVLSMRYSGGVGSEVRTVTFSDRNLGLTAKKNLTGYIVEQSDGPMWEHWYNAVRVVGADKREVLRGVPRWGGQTFELSSDYLSRYSDMHQVADAFFSFFGLRYRTASVKVLAEYASGLAGDIGFQLFDDVTLDGFDEWYVLEINEPLFPGAAGDPAVIELQLVSAIGGSYSPPDDEGALMVIETTKAEPPVIVSVTPHTIGAGPNAFADVVLTYGGYSPRLAGFFVLVWSTTYQRPDAQGRFVPLVGIVSSGGVFSYHAPNLQVGSEYWVDIAAVVIGGGVSEPCVPAKVAP